MFEFFYNHLKPCFSKPGDDIRVLYTDTDSLHLYLKTDDEGGPIPKLLPIRDSHLDGSNLPKDHLLYNTCNKGALGCFKEEMNGKRILEEVCLRPKMYAIKTEDGEEKKTAKGVKKDVIKNVLKFDDYKAIYEKEIAMEENNAQFEEMTNLRSREHVVYTERQRKKCLSIYDNKRIWLSVNESVPIGHPDAPLPKETEKSLRKLRAPFKRRDMLREKGFPMVNVRDKGPIIQYEEESLEDPDQPGPSTSQPIKRRHFGEEEEQSSS